MPRHGSDAGGDGDGYCEPGYRGPRCELCETSEAGSSRYFDHEDASCHDCGEAMKLAVALGRPSRDTARKVANCSKQVEARESSRVKDFHQDFCSYEL